jgi:hypothetical protein
MSTTFYSEDIEEYIEVNLNCLTRGVIKAEDDYDFHVSYYIYCEKSMGVSLDSGFNLDHFEEHETKDYINFGLMDDGELDILLFNAKLDFSDFPNTFRAFIQDSFYIGDDNENFHLIFKDVQAVGYRNEYKVALHFFNAQLKSIEFTTHNIDDRYHEISLFVHRDGKIINKDEGVIHIDPAKV